MYLQNVSATLAQTSHFPSDNKAVWGNFPKSEKDIETDGIQTLAASE